MNNAESKVRITGEVTEPSIELIVTGPQAEVARQIVTPEGLGAEIGAVKNVPLDVDPTVAVQLRRVEGGYVLEHGGKALGVCEKTKLHDDPDLFGTVKILYPPLPKRENKAGKKCGRCVWFDRTQGQAMLFEPTHFYENGTFNWRHEVLDAITGMYGIAGLTKENVGFCVDTKDLCAIQTPACEKYKAISLVLRLRRLLGSGKVT